VGISRCEWENVVHEFLMEFVKRSRLGWDRVTKSRPHFIWDRLPDGTFSDVDGVIKHVIEHPVRLGSKAFPIRWVKRLGLVPGTKYICPVVFVLLNRKYRLFNAHFVPQLRMDAI
jgi:hypothetical protein